MQSKKPPKIIFIGNAAVGKTSLINAYANKSHAGNYKATIGADFHQFQVQIQGKIKNLQIWDTAGQQKFSSFGQAFYRNSHVCVIVFDITDKQSFESVQKWKNGFIKGCDPDDPNNFPFVLLGNKVDLAEKRQVFYEQVQNYLRQNPNFTYLEASAKNQTGLQNAIKKIGEIALSKNQQTIYLPPSYDNYIKIRPDGGNGKRDKKKKACCN